MVIREGSPVSQNALMPLLRSYMEKSPGECAVALEAMSEDEAAAALGALVSRLPSEP